ncbi:MAG TPA: BTAD domain-containing putative transcriptional regulator [Actinoplanes sp.]|nr:BTAD domain-containing putative transcriptional regulator [Actinoplanes sp.]
MTEPGTRIQLCGRFAVELDGRPVGDALPGRRGRLLVALLTVRRPYPVDRATLVEALWPDTDPDAAAAALVVLLSKVRSVLGRDAVVGRTAVTLQLPAAAQVDVEVALAAVHEAESAAAQHQWPRAWSRAIAAQLVTRRPFLPDAEGGWIDEWRGRLDLVHQRALSYYAEACLGIGGTELGGAERAARRLVELAPLSETGYRLLMRTQADQGDVAAALVTYERLRTLLREELGVAPGPVVQELLTRLLR